MKSLSEVHNQSWRKEKFINWSRFQETIKLTPPHRSDWTVFDIASGPAHFADFMVKSKIFQQNQINCFDISSLAVKQAQQKGYQADILDIAKGPTPSRADLIFCLEAIEHIPNPDSVLLHLYNSLKPGGYLIISTPNYARFSLHLRKLFGYSSMPNPNDIWTTVGTSTFSVSSLKQRLKQAGFIIDAERHLFVMESLGRLLRWFKTLFPGLKQKFPHPEYNYVPISTIPNLLSGLVLIRAQKPKL